MARRSVRPRRRSVRPRRHRRAITRGRRGINQGTGRRVQRRIRRSRLYRIRV